MEKNSKSPKNTKSPMNSKSPKNPKTPKTGNSVIASNSLNPQKKSTNLKRNIDKTFEQKNSKFKAMADSAYGNVFPILRGGSTYNTATKLKQLDKKSTFDGIVTPQIKKINGVIEPKGYKLIKEIGSGNYATVYSAINEKNNKMIALKVINLNKASNNYRLKFLPRELKVMSRLRHPNIISIYEILQSSHSIFILMEFAPNGTLSEYICKNSAIPEKKCKIMFKNILEAIHYMHSLSISHRDIKVENVVLDSKMTPKLTDFSYSKSEDLRNDKKRDLSRTFCGSLPYLSPEILQQKSYDPFISDIWSLGIALYVMLCDALPFSIKNMSIMLDNQLMKKWRIHPRVASNVSDSAKNVIALMLEPNVEKRATTTSLLLHKWIKN